MKIRQYETHVSDNEWNLDIEEERGVCWEGSWGASERVPRVMRITATCYPEKMGSGEYKRGGWFEIYDTNTAGEEFYGSGGLWFDADGYLCDYDGVGSLDLAIVEWLDEQCCAISPDKNDYHRERLNKRKASKEASE